VRWRRRVNERGRGKKERKKGRKKGRKKEREALLENERSM
jgi:hypothetical protein